MVLTPMRQIVRHTYTPENGQRGLQFIWFEDTDHIGVHRPDVDGGWGQAAFTYINGAVTSDTLPAVCDDWADARTLR